MDKTRILLHAFRPLDRDVLLRLVRAQPDMEIVGEVDEREDLVRVVSQTRADVVIAAAITAPCRRLLSDATRLRVLAFAPPAPGAVFVLRSQCNELAADLGAEALLDTIRTTGPS